MKVVGWADGKIAQGHQLALHLFIHFMVYLRDLAKSYLHFAKIWFLDVNFLACKITFKNNRLFRFNFNRIWIETIYNSRGLTEVFFNYFVQIILNFNIIIFTYLHINIIWKSEYSCIHITKCKQHQAILKLRWTTKHIIVKHGGHKLSHN